MAINARRKGSGFERLVAKMLLDAAGSDFTKKDAYRTPLSGGHPYAGAGDLVISPKLKPHFPFSVEAKHYRNWSVSLMFAPTKIETGWLDQVLYATAKDTPGTIPLMVMRGNHGKVFCSLPLDSAKTYCRGLKSYPRMLFRYQRQTWVVLLFKHLLAELTLRTRG